MPDGDRRRFGDGWLRAPTTGTNPSAKPAQKVPIMGVGPVFVGVVGMITLALTAANWLGWLNSGFMTGWLRSMFIALGVMLILGGIALWVAAVFVTKFTRHIKAGELITTGVFAWVRHPIYSAFWLGASGFLVAQVNWWLLLAPPMFWAFFTWLMIRTEERWLTEEFGTEYEKYAKRVNRTIPWPPTR